MPVIEAACGVCGKSFYRMRHKIERTLRSGSPSCCSVQCANWYKRKCDDLSPYRIYLKSAIHHARFWKKGKTTGVRNEPREVLITLGDLKQQWQDQQGVCPLTGWQMEFASYKGIHTRTVGSPRRASLDRIDSSKGYILGNIRFICMIAQFAKNKWPDDVVIEFCEAVASWHSEHCSFDVGP